MKKRANKYKILAKGNITIYPKALSPKSGRSL